MAFTPRGYPKIDRTTIVKRCKGCESGSIKTAEVLTDGGLQGCELIPTSLVFEWAIKDNPQLAKAMGAAGATVYMHQLAGFKIDSEAIAEPKPTPHSQPQLTSADRVKVALDLKSVLEFSELNANPRFKQPIQDLFGDILGLNQNSLPAPDAPKWFGVAERAEQLGYSVALVVKHRSQLGKWVAERVGGSIKENRLCNGTQRPINVYPLSPELDEAIVSYLDQFA